MGGGGGWGRRAKEKKKQRKYGPGAERLSLHPFPHRPAAVPFPDLLAGSLPPSPLLPPLLGEPGRSHRLLQKDGLGGDSRRGSRRSRVRGGLELITSILEVV